MLELAVARVPGEGAIAPDLLDEYEAGRLAVELDGEPAEVLLSWALERWGERAALCTAFQAEGMVLVDMAWRIDRRVRVFTVDTGRLPVETYDFIERVREHYGIEVEVFLPEVARLEALAGHLGPNFFRRSVAARLTCCNLRKVEPIRRALDGLDAWITGLRREQWASRAAIRKLEIDHDHGGLAKLNPLADWTHDEVWDYLRDHGVPTHPLYEQGYTSIGCSPCTRPTAPGEDPRAGRWWWEKNAPKECGIHCPLETGGLEHEIEALVAGDGAAALGAGRNGGR
jgi:thioredoxin-dependent adenylylsulfate APS reductase